MNRKGFTLIELLVVIAIIGILSSVVLASLNSARSKGSNVVVKSTLANIRSQAAMFYDIGQTYVGVCDDDAKVVSMLASASSSGLGMSDCASDVDSWSAVAQLKAADADGSMYWCSNSAGLSKGLVTFTEPWATSSCQ